MQNIPRLAVLFCCLWAATLLYGEMVAYWIPRWTCSWPRPSSNFSSSDNDYIKVAVLADPQLMDRTSLGLPAESLALKAAQFYTDINMRRSFHASIMPFKPDAIIFLGDHFDGGPFLSDKEWQESLSRFKHIFAQKEEGSSSNVPVFYLSGNHDIGYAGLNSKFPEVISRYENEFGARNHQFSFGKVDFVVIDAQTLDGPERVIETSVSWDFVKNIAKSSTTNPKVLLTHIPLYRHDWTACGPHRSSPIINQRVSYSGTGSGITYQNYLSKNTSELLLDLLKPVLVLSGHDHDQCTVTHIRPDGNVTEHTLGTISWQQGNLYPSFMLLSVLAHYANKEIDPKDTVFTHLCFLPKQTHIYIWYLFQFVITILLLVFWPTFGNFMSYIRELRNTLMATTKEKDEDENADYEMVWDAEGSMHLVKKPTTKSVSLKSDVGTVGRSNVISRPTAKKHLQEAEESVTVEMNAELNTSKASRLNKSRARKFIQQLVRALQVVMIIAAVNVPLYIMLLFKDWIER